MYGQAGLFDVREIHSIEYGEGAKFVQVTGVDLSRETRKVFGPRQTNEELFSNHTWYRGMVRWHACLNPRAILSGA